MEAAWATACIVGTGFIDSVIEDDETITLIAAEANATASTLKRLQGVINAYVLQYVPEDLYTDYHSHQEQARIYEVPRYVL